MPSTLGGLFSKGPNLDDYRGVNSVPNQIGERRKCRCFTTPSGYKGNLGTTRLLSGYREP